MTRNIKAWGMFQGVIVVPPFSFLMFDQVIAHNFGLSINGQFPKLVGVPSIAGADGEKIREASPPMTSQTMGLGFQFIDQVFGQLNVALFSANLIT
ncbi:MAG TPA: hypothetical protein ENN19_01100 [Chloroflexi bacterium]|nr:hypothetical protein [Chloroflexota bacterium]